MVLSTRGRRNDDAHCFTARTKNLHALILVKHSNNFTSIKVKWIPDNAFTGNFYKSSEY